MYFGELVKKALAVTEQFPILKQEVIDIVSETYTGVREEDKNEIQECNTTWTNICGLVMGVC